jgi:tellurite resistance protein
MKRQVSERMYDRIQQFNPAFFSVVMGLSGLVIAVQQWEHVASGAVFASGIVSQTLLTITSIVFIVVTALYGAKAFVAPDVVRADFAHPVKSNFFAGFSISLLLFAIMLESVQPGLSKAAWTIGAPLHLAVTIILLRRWILTDHEVRTMNPLWFLPIVGNIIVPIAGVAHYPAELSWFFFAVGLINWILMYALIMNRIMFHHPMPRKFLPTLFILMAPPAIGTLSYHKLVGALDPALHVLYYTSAFLFLLLVAMVPTIVRIPFFISWWAYSFPLAAFTAATYLYATLSDLSLLLVAAQLLTLLLAIVICALIVMTVRAIRHGEVCLHEEE